MTTVRVAGVGVRGDGLEGWGEARAVLAGARAYAPAPVVLPAPTMLAPNERRRTSAVTRLALAVAEEAVRHSGLAAAEMRAVFACANGDGATVHAILEALCAPDARVSPTQFHNSVHNAAAGYWSIGAGSRAAATCLGCHDATAAAGLMAAAAQAVAETVPVLLCAYDIALPPPLAAARPTGGAFGAALVLLPDGNGPWARLTVRYRDEAADPTLMWPADPALAALACRNPAGRLLRLLQLLARGVDGVAMLPWLDGSLFVGVAS